MWLHNLVVAEDISPLQPPPPSQVRNTQTHTNHGFVAGRLTFFGATHLSSACVVFVRRSKSSTLRDCPTEQINGLEKSPADAICSVCDCLLMTQHFIKTVSLSALSVSGGGRGFRCSHASCIISCRLHIVTIVLPGLLTTR